MRNTFQEYISIDEERLQLHKNAHSRMNGAKVFMCLITDCTLPHPLSGSFDTIKKSIAELSNKELQILLDKNALKIFTVSEQKKLLGDRYVRR